MHTTISPFSLARFKEKKPHGRTKVGRQGTSPEFGDIRVVYPAGPDMTNALVTEVRGGLIPASTFETRGVARGRGVHADPQPFDAPCG